LACAALVGCPDDAPPIAEGSSSSTGDGPTDGPAPTTTGEPTSDSADTTGDPSTSGADETTGAPPLPPIPCPDEWVCQEDRDGDEVPLSCDNAPQHHNPEQGDVDFDSWGDVVDLCPTVQSLANTADSDDDGVGNDCDVCLRSPNQQQGDVVLPAALAIRNMPYQGDVDRDGLGDACDNCPTVPNCLGYGDGPGLTPWQPGLPIDLEDVACQLDTDLDGVGDACEGTTGPDAAGPAGLDVTDDFDQDGLTNAVDLCPRLPVEHDACASVAECPFGGAGASCDEGVCNHLDPDGDGVGSECDTCPFVANPGQVIDGMMQDDDEDGDFVGDACEHPSCVPRRNPRTLAFYDVAVGGLCCATRYQGQPLMDPDGVPLDPRTLPVSDPGLLVLPPGCEEALANAGVGEATALQPVDVGGVDELWPYLCLLPPWDQDFDGLPDECDLCPFAYDPTNAPYVDDDGMEWPNDGAYCNGDYHCAADEG
jgi:hypothetical protein